MIYGDGDVQWMRAGRGVIHEEMWNLDALKKPAEASGAKEKESSRDHSQNLLGQKIEIFQLWINLPKKNKDDPPMLHLLKAEDIPVLRCSNGGYVRVICGDVAANTGSDNGVTDPNPPVEKLASAKHSLNVAASPVSILQVSVPSNDKLHFMIPGKCFFFFFPYSLRIIIIRI